MPTAFQTQPAQAQKMAAEMLLKSQEMMNQATWEKHGTVPRLLADESDSMLSASAGASSVRVAFVASSAGSESEATTSI